MKKKTILYLVSLFFLSVPLTGRGQDKKAWEIGAGGSLCRQNQAHTFGDKRVSGRLDGLIDLR